MTERQHTIENWDAYWRRKSDLEKVYSNEGRIARNLERVTELKDRKILEVGAGTGRDSVDLARRGAFVVVLDKSYEAISLIRKTIDECECRSGLVPVIGDVRRLPFRDGTFHVVFHQGLLEHFHDPDDVLSENLRVLPDEGILLVDVPQRYHPYTLVKHLLMALGKWFAGWETEYTIRQLSDTVRRAGFRRIVHRYGAWMYPGFIYRLIREIFLGIGIELPLYPTVHPALRRWRDCFRNRAAGTGVSYYTYHTIGVIAMK